MTVIHRAPAPVAAATVVSALAVAAYLAAAPSLRLWLLVAAPLAAGATVVVSVARSRPARPGPWLLLALALLASAAGSAVQAQRQAITAGAWFGFITGSVAVGVAILGFTTPAAADRDRLVWMDSAIGLVSLGTLGYQFLVQPYVDAGARGTAIASAAALPALDLVLLGLLMRLRDRGPRRTVALGVLVGALCGAVGSDTVVGLATISGRYRPGSAWDLFAYAAYLALGTASLHPSMTQVGLPAVGVPPSRVPGLLLLLPAGVVVPALSLGAALRWLHLDMRVAAVAGLLLFLLAMTRAIEVLARTERASLHDALTGLANLRRFRQELARSAGQPYGVTSILALLDLDDFKTVNDTYGHTIGDALLVQVADRLTASLGPALLIARFGGDEFGVLAVGPDADAEAHADRIGSQILSLFTEPFVLDGLPVRVSASVGVVISPDVQSLERLQVDADIAMYAAKNAGRGTYRVYSRELRQQVLGERVLASELEHALGQPATGGLWVAYQPVVAVEGAGVVGLEALVRWQHPERGPLAPADFLPTAERAGLSRAVDEFVLATALRQLAAWCALDPGFRSVRVGVNMAAASLDRPDLVEYVLAEVSAAGLEPRQLTIEITEQSAVPGDARLAAALRELAAAGVQLAIDDFGTGYSALHYLERFPISVLKLDRTLISEIDRQPSSLLAAVAALARSLDLTVVAEGVERAGQLAALEQLDIQCAQGFLFSPARSAGTIEAYVQEHATPATADSADPSAAPHAPTAAR